MNKFILMDLEFAFSYWLKILGDTNEFVLRIKNGDLFYKELLIVKFILVR